MQVLFPTGVEETSYVSNKISTNQDNSIVKMIINDEFLYAITKNTVSMPMTSKITVLKYLHIIAFNNYKAEIRNLQLSNKNMASPYRVTFRKTLIFLLFIAAKVALSSHYKHLSITKYIVAQIYTKFKELFRRIYCK